MWASATWPSTAASCATNARGCEGITDHGLRTKNPRQTSPWTSAMPWSPDTGLASGPERSISSAQPQVLREHHGPGSVDRAANLLHGERQDCEVSVEALRFVNATASAKCTSKAHQPCSLRRTVFCSRCRRHRPEQNTLVFCFMIFFFREYVGCNYTHSNSFFLP